MLAAGRRAAAAARGCLWTVAKTTLTRPSPSLTCRRHVRFVWGAGTGGPRFTPWGELSLPARRGFASAGGHAGGSPPPAEANFPSKVASVTTNHSSAMLQVRWDDGGEDVYPYVWLRDNCRCAACFHPGSHSRLIPVQALDTAARPATVQVEGSEVTVTWTDGHEGRYAASWLRPRAFSSPRRRARADVYALSRRYCGAEALHQLPRISFRDVMACDATLLAWLQQLEVFGFTKVQDAPTETGQVRRLAERVGFIKKTHYGEDFTVKAKPDPSNVAYLGGPLQLHADLPYYQYKPGVQFIHCLVQYAGEGGDSLMVDAIHAARHLRHHQPHFYHILTHTPIDWFDVGSDETGEFRKNLRLPMICTDVEGHIIRINFSQPQRDSFFSVAAEEVLPWYEAFLAFHRLLAHPDFCYKFKMQPGTILTLDNLRMVHGRTSYLSGSGERHIEGCYVDWDEVRSRRRVLEVKLGHRQSHD